MQTSLATALDDEPGFDTEAALRRVYEGETMSEAEAEGLFGALVAGDLAEPATAAMLVALKLRGEATSELIGAARALRAAAAPFPRPDYPFADTCGTGGDGSGSINVSTAVAFVVAAAGLPVVKHGNRSVTSRCGSADVLEALGARIDVPATVSRQALDRAGICFLFAPAYHPGLRHAAAVRRLLKVRTMMNMLGPCVNPSAPPIQLLGVADPKLLEPVAATLAALGTAKALVVHGAGLDEIALHAPTDAVRVDGGRFERITITPEDAGLSRQPLSALRGGDADENAARLAALLRGEAPGAEADMVALNAGALLWTAGLADGLREGVRLAAETIASGGAHERLGKFVAATNA